MIVHGKAQVTTAAQVTMSTMPAQWSYALSYGLVPGLLNADNTLTSDFRCVLEPSVSSGHIGLGWTNLEDSAFIEERYVASGSARTSFTLRAGTRVGRLMFSNVASGGIPSQFSILAARSEVVTRRGRTYPVAIGGRIVRQDPVPDHGGPDVVFDTAAAHAINAARREWLERANLPVAGGRVLDVGCGMVPSSRSTCVAAVRS